MTKLIVAFLNFANASKNCRCVLVNSSVLHICGISLFADFYGAVGLCDPGTVCPHFWIFFYRNLVGHLDEVSVRRKGLPTLNKIRHAHKPVGRGGGVIDLQTVQGTRGIRNMYDHTVLEVWNALNRAATEIGKWIYRFQICDTTHKNQLYYVLLLNLNLLQTEIRLRDLAPYQCCSKMQVFWDLTSCRWVNSRRFYAVS